MDVTVSIVNTRSLSHSEMIMRNLVSLVQVGSTRQGGTSVLMQGAKFRSGTVENPLVIMLKNSQTETMMYVRNIPMSAVLGRRGPFEQWVAVYPPGDPQNLHFDAAVTPKEGCPQVLVSVIVEEDVSPARLSMSPPAQGFLGASPIGGSPTNPVSAFADLPPPRNDPGFGFVPPARASGIDHSLPSVRSAGMEHSVKVDNLRHSMGSIQSEVLKARERVQGLGGESQSTFSSTFSGSAGLSRESNGAADVREKELQAKRIKEHLAEMSSAGKRAQNMTKTLQDNLRILEGLRRQFQDLEMQLAEQRAATSILERDRDQLREEEQQALEQGRHLEAAYDEYKSKLDDISRQLSQALGQRDQQKTSLDMTSRDFNLQKQGTVSELEQSKRDVSNLATSVQSKQSMIADLERRHREADAARRAQDSIEREKMRSLLDQTRRDLSGAQVELDQQQRLHQGAASSKEEVVARIAGIEREIEHLSGEIRSKEVYENVKVDIDAKKRELESHVAKVKRLEEHLQQNREQLSGLSNKIAELNIESRDKELAARRCEDVQEELKRKLEDHQRAKAARDVEREAGESQVNRATQALQQARSRWDELEAQVAESRANGASEASALEQEVKDKRGTLDEVQREVQSLRGLCDELDMTATSRRALVHERRDALDVARARVNELTRQLEKASGEIAGSDSLLKRLEEGAESCSSNLETVRRELKEKQDTLAVMQDQTARAGELHSQATSTLEETAASVQNNLDSLVRSREEAAKQRIEAESSVTEHQEVLTKLQSQADQLEMAKQQHESERDILLKEHESITAELRASTEQVASLESASQACDLDLTSTRSSLTSKLRQAVELKATYQEELARMDSDMEALVSERAESQRLHEQVSKELEECRREHGDKLVAIASAEEEKRTLAAKLERMRTEHTQAVDAECLASDMLKQTESKLGAITANCVRHARRVEDCEAQLGLVESNRERINSRLVSLRAELPTVTDELQLTRSCLEQKRSEANTAQELAQMEATLTSIGNAPAEVRELATMHAELLAELEVDEAKEEEMLKNRAIDLELTKSEAQHKQSVTLQKKNDELQRQVSQIDQLESEKRKLEQQLQSMTVERRQLEETIVQREQGCSKLLTASQDRSQECDALHQTMQQVKEASSQMSEREKVLEMTWFNFQQQEEIWRTEAQDHTTKLLQLKQEMETTSAQARGKIEGHSQSLEQHRQLSKAQQLERESLKQEVEFLEHEEFRTRQDCVAIVARTEEIGHELVKARSDLVATQKAREENQRTMLEWSKQVKELQNSKGGLQARQNSGLPGAAEMEQLLQEASDRLMAAQELLRRRRAEEEELRSEVLKLKESVRASSDKMSYQVEHDSLQFETIQKLQEQKDCFEKEVELLTLGLHEEQQKVHYLQETNDLMEREIEGIDHTSLQVEIEMQRVQVANEVTNYKEQTDVWKQKAERIRKQKTQELARLQRQGEQTVQQLMDKSSKMKADIDAREQRYRRRAVAEEKHQKRGMVDAPSSAVPGLVVPQRPLPPGHHRRKALLVGINYIGSHAPLTGCINDVWNLQCLLRYTLQYGSDQLRLLLDGADGRGFRSDCTPTKENILAGLSWLTSDARPGDSLLFAFSGYGTQHPRSPESGDQHEAYIVPCDFAADLPSAFFQEGGSRSSSAGQRSRFAFSSLFGGSATQESESGYRLVSMLEIQELISKLPKAVRFTSLFDTCFSLIPNVHPAKSCPVTFTKISEGPEAHAILRELMPRPRYLQLPVLPVRHCPPHVRGGSFPVCWFYNFGACNMDEWSAEMPIEGTVQGVFTWAFLKAFGGCHFHCSVYQAQAALVKALADLKATMKGIEQTPVLQLSQSAGINDVLIGT